MQWSTQPIWNSHLLVAVVTTVLLSLLLLGPRYRLLSTRRRAALVGLRLGVILLVVLALLRPTLINTATKPQSAALVIMMDQSRSMSLPNTSGGESRWRAQCGTLEQCQTVLGELAKDLQLKIYAFDSELQNVEFARNKLRFPKAPEGRYTDIGTCLHEAVRRESGNRLAGVVLLSDGAQTAFDPQVEVHEAGRELARLGVPLYAVAFGPPGDAAQARDIAIESMPEEYTVFVKNELEVKGVLRVRGYVNKDIPVELIVEDAGGMTQILGPVVGRAQQDNQQVQVAVTYEPQQPGQYKLMLRAAQQPGELVASNNQLSAYLTVLEGGLKVLYFDQRRWERKFLSRSIDASPDMELDLVLVDHRLRDQWPVEKGDAVNDKRYDAFIIGDVPADALGKQNLQTLAAAVESGKGLIMLGGYHSFGPGGYHDSPLGNVLPIEMGPYERQGYDDPIREDLHIPGPLPMTPVGEHPVTRLAPGEENLRVWRSLPALEGANRFFQVKQGPGIQVIAEAANGAPLLVAGEYARGRALAFAGDTTYLWALAGREAEHKRFWRQVILWLLRREDLQRGQVWIKLPRRRYQPGNRVTFDAGARTAAGDAIENAELSAELLGRDGQRQPLRLSQGDDHWSGFVERIESPGDYSIEVQARVEGTLLGSARARFQVLDQDIELSNPAADPDQMDRLAAHTREFHGGLLAPEQLPDLFRQMQQRPPEMEIKVQTRWQIADTALDAWLFFLFVVGLLTAEWALRKKWGLV